MYLLDAVVNRTYEKKRIHTQEEKSPVFEIAAVVRLQHHQMKSVKRYAENENKKESWKMKRM